MSENEGRVLTEDKYGSPDGFSVLHIIEQQALKNPDAVAVMYGKTSLTYRELDSRSNQLAHFFMARGVKENGMYPIFMERSLEMILVMLGILKAGGAYVPVDPEYPQQRIDLILRETQAPWMLCLKKLWPKLHQLSMTTVLEWEDIQAEVNAQPSDKPSTNLKPHHLAYVIFTSGSTGKPKGVMIEHAQLFYSTRARNRYYPSFSSILLIPSFSFDAAVGAIFGCFSHGSR